MLKLDIAKLFINKLMGGEKQSHLDEEYWFSFISKKDDISAIPQKIKSEVNKKVSGFFDSGKSGVIYVAMRPKTTAPIQLEKVKEKFIKLIKNAILADPDNENTLEESVVDVNLGDGKNQDFYFFAGFEIEK